MVPSPLLPHIYGMLGGIAQREFLAAVKPVDQYLSSPAAPVSEGI